MVRTQGFVVELMYDEDKYPGDNDAADAIRTFFILALGDARLPDWVEGVESVKWIAD